MKRKVKNIFSSNQLVPTEMELTEEEIAAYKAKGIKVDELFDKGGEYTYGDRNYKKDNNGNWSVAVKGVWTPLSKNVEARTKELNKNAKFVKDLEGYNQNQLSRYDMMENNKPQVADNTKVQITNKPVPQQQKFETDPMQIMFNKQNAERLAQDPTKGYTLPQGGGEADWVWAAPLAGSAVLQAAGAIGSMALPGLGAVPGATVGNLVNSGFIANSLYDLPKNVNSWYDVSQGNKDWKEAALESGEIAAGMIGSGSGFKSLGKDISRNVKPSNIFPQYKDVYRVEPTSFVKDIGDDLSGRWMGELGEMPFYVRNLKDKTAGVRILKQRMPVKKWEAVSGHNMPEQAKTMSAGLGDYKTVDEVANAGYLTPNSATRFNNGLHTTEDLAALSSNPKLINLNEGIVSDALANKLRTNKRSLLNRSQKIEYPAGDMGREGAMDYLLELSYQTYKKQGVAKPILGIPRSYFPFEKGGVVQLGEAVEMELTQKEIDAYLAKGIKVEYL
jgi:hypothetical protein